MKYLNLDIHFQPLGKTIEHKAFQFKGGEPHIKITEVLNQNDEVTITTRIRSFNDLGLLLVAVDALRRMKIKSIYLVLPYFPGARQDRLMVKGEPLTVKVYADLINNLKLNKVTIVDPHSEVTSALLNNVLVVDNNLFVAEATKGLNNFILIAPDSGALKKIYKTAQFLGGVEVVKCGKKRDVRTGKLSGFKVYEEDLDNKTCVVVDDICDGGGTFLGLAEQLKAHNAGKLILIVTHGLFTKGLDELAQEFDQIICTDAFDTNNDEKLTQIKLNNKLLK